MACVLPFAALRPAASLAGEVAALPYDVYDAAGARAAVAGHPHSFLNIDRPETQFEPDHDMYAPDVYEKAAGMLADWEREGVFVQDEAPAYYVYELTMDGRTQTGIAALSSVDDYLSGVCKKHENTVAAKEADRIRHVDVCSAQTGPIFLAYRRRAEISELTEAAKEAEPLYDITFEDGIRHRLWRVAEPETVAALREAFADVPATYIADGHHRAASAVKVSLARREAHPDYDGTEEFNYFLSVLFPDNELMIMDYNRVVRDLNGLTPSQFRAKLSEVFYVTELMRPEKPSRKNNIGLYLGGRWYALTFRTDIVEVHRGQPVGSLDVSMLQEEVLEPVLGIKDPRTDARIRFVGGIHGLTEVKAMVDEAQAGTGLPGCAFFMFPTSIRELFAVADAGLLMPPKSTWFEPKLRSGFLIHKIER